MVPELIFYNGRKLTEGLYYHENDGILYFVAIRDNLIHAFSPDTGEVKTYTTNGPVGGVVVRDGVIVEAEKHGIYSIDPKTGEKSLIKHIIENNKMRYNHLILDSKQRILVDVMGDEERSEGKGGLYSIEGDHVRTLVYGTTVANGMGFSNDGRYLYFTDTVTRMVMRYEYSQETGEIGTGQAVVKINDGGLPDGLCVDSKDMLWVTEWGGGKIGCWNPNTGVKEEEIRLPCRNVTSCCIGGGWLYIATAKCEQYNSAPAGGIFRVKIG